MEKSQSWAPAESRAAVVLGGILRTATSRPEMLQCTINSNLSSIWKERCIIDFDDKFGLDEIVTRIYKIFNNKSELVDYFDEEQVLQE